MEVVQGPSYHQLDTLKVYAEGAEAWFPDNVEGWILGKLVERKLDDKKIEMRFSLPNREEDVVVKTTFEELVKNEGMNLPPLHNPPALSGVDDLAMLSYLHEPAVLYNIRIRYLNGYIYTYSGIVLIAMNPFANVAIYRKDVMRSYRNKQRDDLDPHVYAAAEVSLQNLRGFRKSQSIIVSGESGAGKTQSAKYLMQYFTNSNRDYFSKHEQQNFNELFKDFNIEDTVLSTNPIMESFGNSKTVRNDNSSRFGKYTEVFFTDPDVTGEPRICGANIRTYLLERSRVTFQPPRERGYHIFYQLCAAAPAAERKELGLKSWKEFNYLNQGNAGLVESIDDKAMFTETTGALSTAKISFSTQWNMFRICAAILHIGNIQIKQYRDRVGIEEDDALLTATKLLGIDSAEFVKWILARKIEMRLEKIIKPLDLVQATALRDSISKFIYSSLFSWLVKELGKNLSGCVNPKFPPKYFIGVLDIYGFEHFKENSFEQFCINYANEKLQQEFNSHVFKLEQEEYMAEKIEWSFITFTDNKLCIDLIEGKLGIFDLLDEESRLQMGTDRSLLSKLNDKFLGVNKFYIRPRFGEDSFAIKHYACEVTYKIDGFIEKNKDTVPEEQLNVMASSKFDFFKEILFHNDSEDGPSDEYDSKVKNKGKDSTLGRIFKDSLVQLMDKICKTEVHYIRCIKPNSGGISFKFDPVMVLQQLRACGVLETIRISCEGYPTRATFEDFVERYYMLVGSSKRTSVPKKFTLEIANGVLTGEGDKYQIGLTKVFFRAGQLAYLETLRNDKLNNSAMIIQRNCLTYVYKKRFILMVVSAMRVQRVYRMHVAVKLRRSITMDNSCITIQKYVRRMQEMRSYRIAVQKIVAMQITFRYVNARDIVRGKMWDSASTKVQKVFRGYSQRLLFHKSVKVIVGVQSNLRKLLVLDQVPGLIKEARSVGKLKETNLKLESKVFELSKDISETKAKNEMLLSKLTKADAGKKSWKEKFLALEKLHNEEVAKLTTEYTDEISHLKGALKDAIERNFNLEGTLKEKTRIIEEARKARLATAGSKHLPKWETAKSERGLPQMRSPSVGVDGINKVDSSKSILSSFAMGTILSRSQDLKKKDQEIFSSTVQQLSRTKSKDDKSSQWSPNTDNSPPTPVHPHAVSPPHVSKNHTAGTFPVSSSVERIKYNIIDRLKYQALIDEVRINLVENLTVPQFNINDISSRNLLHVLFPANIIGSLCTLLVDNELYEEFYNLLSSVNIAIKNTINCKSDYEGSFWLSNCCVIASIIHTIAKDNSMHISGLDPDKRAQAKRYFSTALRDYISTVNVIFMRWFEYLRETITPILTPALVESQPLTGYVLPKKKRHLWNPLQFVTRTEEHKIEDVTNFLGKISLYMNIYFVCESAQYSIINRLYSYINAVVFNDSLSMKGFWTWTRGIQLLYNVGNLQEWSDLNGFKGARLNLTCLEQAGNLIQMSKNDASTIDSISDVCHSLGPAQIRRIMLIYVPTDGEEKVSQALVDQAMRKTLASKDDDSKVFIDVPSTYSYDFTFEPEIYEPIPRFIPKWLVMPLTSSLVNNS